MTRPDGSDAWPWNSTISANQAPPNSGVALGYLFGPTLQILAVFAVVVAFGWVLCWAAYSPPGRWVGGNVLVLSGAFTLWAMVVFASMRLAKPVSPIGVLIGAIVLGNVGLVLIPAAGDLLQWIVFYRLAQRLFGGFLKRQQFYPTLRTEVWEACAPA